MLPNRRGWRKYQQRRADWAGSIDWAIFGWSDRHFVTAEF